MTIEEIREIAKSRILRGLEVHTYGMDMDMDRDEFADSLAEQVAEALRHTFALITKEEIEQISDTLVASFVWIEEEDVDIEAELKDTAD